MPSNAVVVADDNAESSSEIVRWLKANDVAAYASSDSSVMRLVDEVGARVVICRPGSSGIALFHELQESTDPPMVVLLSDAPSARDEVYCNGRIVVAVIRVPVQMSSLARFVKQVASISVRLDREALAALAAQDPPPVARPQSPVPLRVVH